MAIFASKVEHAGKFAGMRMPMVMNGMTAAHAALTMGHHFM